MYSELTNFPSIKVSIDPKKTSDKLRIPVYPKKLNTLGFSIFDFFPKNRTLFLLSKMIIESKRDNIDENANARKTPETLNEEDSHKIANNEKDILDSWRTVSNIGNTLRYFIERNKESIKVLKDSIKI